MKTTSLLGAEWFDHVLAYRDQNSERSCSDGTGAGPHTSISPLAPVSHPPEHRKEPPCDQWFPGSGR